MLNIAQRISEIDEFENVNIIHNEVEKLPVIELSKINELPQKQQEEIENLLDKTVRTCKEFIKVNDNVKKFNSLNNINEVYKSKINNLISDINAKKESEIARINQEYETNMTKLKEMFTQFSKQYEDKRIEQIDETKKTYENLKNESIAQLNKEKERDTENHENTLEIEKYKLELCKNNLINCNKILVAIFNSLK